MKLYLHGYRNKGIFFEAASNQIFEDLNAVTQAKWARLETLWRGRGGIRSNVIVESAQAGYSGLKPNCSSYSYWFYASIGVLLLSPSDSAMTTAATVSL